jgi:hypothetical protein
MVTVVPPGKPVWSRQARIGDYGGALDKRDCRTETIPYAWGVYRELRAMRGSAYTQSTTSLVHVENLAIARMFCGILRAAEKLESNSLPGTASDNLAEWATIEGVASYAGEAAWQLRLRAATRYRITGIPTRTVVEDALRQLMGSAFSSCLWSEGGLLSTPPSPTYWPGVNDGPLGLDLGGGTWMSRRAHLVVYVTRDFALNSQEFDNLVQFQMRDLLRYMLPAHATYDWAAVGDGSDGFYLNISLLSYDAL